MSWVAVAIGGSALLGYMGSQNQADAATQSAQAQSQAANEAAKLQAETSQKALDFQREMFNKQLELGKPYRDLASEVGLPKIREMLPQFSQMPEQYKPFTAADLKTNLAPNYQFMLEQGLGATRQGMNVGSPGSNTERAATKFAEDYASNAYQNALQNYMSQQAQGFNQRQSAMGDIYNRLSNLAGLGQTSVSNAATAAGQTGSNVANTMMNTAGNIGQLGIGSASALGAGQVGAANAMAGGLQNIGNSAMLYSFLRPQATGGYNYLTPPNQFMGPIQG